jgi:hypothetical protein
LGLVGHDEFARFEEPLGLIQHAASNGKLALLGVADVSQQVVDARSG